MTRTILSLTVTYYFVRWNHSYIDMCMGVALAGIEDAKAYNALSKFYICCPTTLPLQNGRWGVGGIKEGETGDRLVTYVCPQHFCQCLRVTNISLELTCSFLFNPKSPDEQCICGRQGTLYFCPSRFIGSLTRLLLPKNCN